MAPEQSGADVDARADVFALGKILEIAAGTGTHPEVPKPLASICRRATEPDRALRYSGPMELSADIAAYLDHMPVSAHRDSIAERLVRFTSRHRILLALVAAYLVMRIAVIFWFRR
jgi:hypothetical protein